MNDGTSGRRSGHAHASRAGARKKPAGFRVAGRALTYRATTAPRRADEAGGVTDEAWSAAAEHFGTDQLIALVGLIAVINAYNRLNVIVQQPAGDYRPGMFG